MRIEFSPSEVRRFWLSRQFPDVTPGLDGVRAVIEHLGYIQLDTIQVVERAHHHTLWNRVVDYSSQHLHELLTNERSVFEYWGHAASYLPISDYRFYRPKMDAMVRDYGWESSWWEANRDLIGKVLARVREEGPLTVADFEDNPEKRGQERSADSKPAKTALELLFWHGDLMVSERRGFQRVYDLTERVLPPDVSTVVPSPEELGAFQIRRALRAQGVVSAADIEQNLFFKNRAGVKAALQQMLDSGKLVRLAPLLPKTVHYADPEILDREIPMVDPTTVRILSPFDNLTINRRRMKDWFGFEYSLECYLPEAKRVYGYFVLPVLQGERFIARIDAKAERKTGVLLVKTLHFESDFADFTDAMTPLSRTLVAYARFNGCTTVQIEECRPAKVKATLNRLLKKEM